MSQVRVEKLSERKQKLSMGEIKRREKDKAQSNNPRKSVRTTVVDPGDFEWPSIKAEDEEKLLSYLESDFGVLKLPIQKVSNKFISKIEKSKRREYRSDFKQEQATKHGIDLEEFGTLRSSLTMGVNSASRALEMNELAALIIEKDVNPEIITKLLVPVAKAKRVPIVALHGLSKTCFSTFNTRCLALGLKHACRDERSNFNRVYKFVYEITGHEDLYLLGANSQEDDHVGSSSSQMSPVVLSADKEHPQAQSRKTGSDSDSSGLLPPKVRKMI